MNSPETLELVIDGMHCGGCARKVREALLGVPGVREAEVDPARGIARIRHDGADAIALATAVRDAGYRLHDTPAAVPVPAACPLPTQTAASAQQLRIEGMHCASCVTTIETALRAVPGVTQANVNLADRLAHVQGTASTDTLLAAVSAAGYSASPLADDAPADDTAAEQAHYRRLLRNTGLALGLGLPLMAWGLAGGSMQVMAGQASQGLWFGIGVLTLAVMWAAGGHFFRGAWKAFLHHHASMDTLIAIGTGSAWLYSMTVVLLPDLVPIAARHLYFEASATIIGLINLGLALEARARGKTGQAIRRLLDLRPKHARRIGSDGEESDIPVEAVQVGDRLRVRPGETMAVDGEVESGHSHIDESMLTGEPMPVLRQPGDRVAAGTLNREGTLVYRATRVGKDTALARIIRLVRQAQGAKPPIGRLADAVAAVFVPTVLLIAIATALAWYNLGPEPRAVHMLVAATTVLIIACPCALGLATPMSIMVGVGKAAEDGILIRRGDALQAAASLNTVVLDKTGTITEGRPSMTRLVTATGIRDADALQWAASLEQASEHPLAQAMVTAARERALPCLPVSDFAAINGRGVRGTVASQALLLGNRDWLNSEGVDTHTLDDAAASMAAAGGTPLYLAASGQPIAVFGVADRIKADSRAAIARLHARGLQVVMITGDIAATAQAIANEAGIDEVFAGVLPEHKAEKIRALKARGGAVAMVGDGINDAPALAGADVGFAIGTGTDVAIESADITLMRGSLHGVADAIEIAEATLRNIRQNLFGAFIYNILGIPVAAGLLYPLWGILLNPVMAGAAMSLSSVTVVSNANRLRWFKPSRSPESMS